MRTLAPLERAVGAVTRPPRPHGTHACYVHGPDRAHEGRGCRCEPCRAANAAYERERARRPEPPYVSASSARDHVAWLATQGVGLKTIAKASGVSHGALSKLVYGDPRSGRGPSKRIRPATRDAILAVMPTAVADGAKVPAAPVWADVTVLLERGWTKAAIARAIGQTGPGLQLGREYVAARNARAVKRLLGQPVPPRRSRHGEHPVESPAPLAVEVPVADPYQLPSIRVAPPELRRGACRVPAIPTWLFFPHRGDAEVVERAKKVCATCPVAAACLEYALEAREPGVWGGTTGAERRELRRGRAAA